MEQKHKTETMTRTIALKQIGTPRLVIRPLNEEDVPNIYGIMSDYEQVMSTGGYSVNLDHPESLGRELTRFNYERLTWRPTGEEALPAASGTED